MAEYDEVRHEAELFPPKVHQWCGRRWHVGCRVAGGGFSGK